MAGQKPDQAPAGTIDDKVKKLRDEQITHWANNDPKKVFPKDINSPPDLGQIRANGRKMLEGVK
jgi:hypothetical protein